MRVQVVEKKLMLNFIKVRKHGKKLVVLLMIVLCVNTFGAVVSANDGSAFITKTEFDALN